MKIARVIKAARNLINWFAAILVIAQFCSLVSAFIFCSQRLDSMSIFTSQRTDNLIMGYLVFCFVQTFLTGIVLGRIWRSYAIN